MACVGEGSTFDEGEQSNRKDVVTIGDLMHELAVKRRYRYWRLEAGITAGNVEQGGVLCVDGRPAPPAVGDLEHACPGRSLDREVAVLLTLKLAHHTFGPEYLACDLGRAVDVDRGSLGYLEGAVVRCHGYILGCVVRFGRVRDHDVVTPQ